MTDTPRISGIILAGGRNRRMQGHNKALLHLGRDLFLDRLLTALAPDCSDRLVVARDLAPFKQHGVRTVRDQLKIRGPLTGIHAGLLHMQGDFGFVTSCDTPFLKSAVVHLLATYLDPQVDVVVPLSGSFYQPLCAIYAARCVPLIEAMLARSEVKVDRLYTQINLKTVPYEEIQRVDPHLDSFFNVNTPDDLETARKMLRDFDKTT